MITFTRAALPTLAFFFLMFWTDAGLATALLFGVAGVAAVGRGMGAW